MISGDLIDLDQAGSLAMAESVVRARRRADLDEIRLVLHWADLHAGDPQDEPGAVPVRYGGDHLITLGGDGTPSVGEFCWAEFAIARRAGVIATKNLAADALDLRHRLPSLYARVSELEIEVWLARKVATLSRGLSAAAVRVVDAAIAAAGDLAPGRLLALVEAKVIEADLAAHQTQVERDAARTGVWLQRPRIGDVLGAAAGGAGQAATRGIAARLQLGQALDLDATVDMVADRLAEQDDYREMTRDQLRAEALALMAFPDRVIALLEGPVDTTVVQEAGHGLHGIPSARPSATIYVHIAEAAVGGLPAIARCDRLGPLLIEQVIDLLRLREVTVQPVIDLNEVHAVDGYEHPTAVKRRTELRTGGDVFPHSTHTSVRLDHDHVRPYDPGGPPGQTGDLNDAPLTRFHHRVKTHQHGWQVDQLALGVYRWVSPHGLVRIVTPAGT